MSPEHSQPTIFMCIHAFSQQKHININTILGQKNK